MLSMSLAAQTTKSRGPSHGHRNTEIPRLAQHSCEYGGRGSWPAILDGSASEPILPVAQEHHPHPLSSVYAQKSRNEDYIDDMGFRFSSPEATIVYEVVPPVPTVPSKTGWIGGKDPPWLRFFS
jgi:hypothetical protein